MRTMTVLPMACAVAALLCAQRPAAIAPGTKKVNSKDGLTYVWIPPGKFQMGCSPGDAECFDNERPAHEVTITKGFWLGQTSVTQQAYRRVTGKNPANHKGANLPVEEVDWNEAQAYCKAIGGRLPTEAEWEYAARAGSTGVRYGNLDEIAWYDENSGNQSHEVGQKAPNAFGLYDMLGNTWQWVADWNGPYQPGPQTRSNRARQRPVQRAARRFVGQHFQAHARVVPRHGRAGAPRRQARHSVRRGMTFPLSLSCISVLSGY